MDFLQKKTKKNEGEVPQYYVEGNHEAIIDPVTFDYVQAEMVPIRADSAFLAADNPIPLVAAKNALTESAVNCVPRKKVSVLVFNYSQF